MSYEPRLGLGASARALFDDLAGLQYHGVLFGHQDASLTGCLDSSSKWDATSGSLVEPDVFRVSDKYPAVYGFDFGWLTESEVFPISSPALFSDTEEAFLIHQSLAYDCFTAGGIVTFSWHIANSFTWNLDDLVAGRPPFAGLNAEKRLGKAFSAAEATIRGQDPANDRFRALDHEGKLHPDMKRKLTIIADFAKSMAYDGTPIPILFRPFHENNIDYFWWSRGINQDQDYIDLWRETVRFLDNAGATNFLYVFSPHVRRSLASFQADFDATYPGKDWVDVVAIDFYPERRRLETEASAPQAQDYVDQVDFLCRRARREGKLAAISECGVEKLQRLENNKTEPVDDYWTDDYLRPFWDRDDNLISYALVWKNVDPKGEFFGPYPCHSSVPDFELMAANSKTLVRCGCKFLKKVLFREDLVQKRACFARWRGANQTP